MIALEAENFGGRGEMHDASIASGRAVQDLVECRPDGLLGQPAEEVFLQRLPGMCRSAPEHTVDVVGDILDLNTWHGAIMALLAPKCNRSERASAAC